MNRFYRLAVFIFFGMMVNTSCDKETPTEQENEFTALRVDGRVLKNGRGQTVRLCGVNIASLEWTNNGEHIFESIQEATTNWGANAIRLPLSQDRWFGRAPGQTDAGLGYQAIVNMAVKNCTDKKCYLILDLHWSNAGKWGQNIGQHKMPDQYSLAFWQSVAEKYKNHPAILFDIYNEPHNVSWEIWRDGGTVTEEQNGQELTYAAIGLQQLVDAIRKKRAKNVIIAGGLDWGYDLAGVANGYALSDPDGNGIMYSSHIYPWKGNNAAAWNPHVAVIADEYPVFIGEAGCRPEPNQEDPFTWAPKIIQYINDFQFSWTAWCFHPSAGPCIIESWNYDPTPYWGVFVKEALLIEQKKRR